MKTSRPSKAIRRFLELEAAGGILLLAASGVALLFANIPGLAGWYQYFLDVPIEIKLGGLELHKNVHLVINDGLMAIFFLLVGLEIKRETLERELAGPSRLALPALAALGGVALPGAIYAWMTWGDPVATKGWAIPAATDIAFSLGVLSLLGSRVPLSLKVFLTTVAVVDDLVAIVIIAILYTSRLSLTALLLGVGGLVILVILNRLRMRHLGAYILVGAIMWICVLKSGVHATLAGVALGLAIPLKVQNDHGESLLRHLEHILHPWVAFMILPLFAFANAGVSFKDVSSEALFGPITLGIAGGLCLGKPLGVFGCSALIVWTGLAKLPKGVTWSMMAGAGLLAGIGFTMSLFIGMLAFEEQGTQYEVATRMGVFGASIISAIAGFLVLRLILPRSAAAGDRPPAVDGNGA
ncbi:MAG: Na+/H+ antiporter NhaA [Phycisphaerae bacterium]